MVPAVSAQTLSPAQAPVLVILGVPPAQGLPPGEGRGPRRQRAGQTLPQHDVTGGGAGVFADGPHSHVTHG